jgi:hypothetical protein
VLGLIIHRPADDLWAGGAANVSAIRRQGSVVAHELAPFIRVPLREREPNDENGDVLIATSLIEVCVPIKEGGTRIYLRRGELPTYVDTAFPVDRIVNALMSRSI